MNCRFIRKHADRLANLYPVTPEMAFNTLSLCGGNVEIAEAVFQLCAVVGPNVSPLAVASFVMEELRKPQPEPFAD